jgi:hypothetical protein
MLVAELMVQLLAVMESKEKILTMSVEMVFVEYLLGMSPLVVRGMSAGRVLEMLPR